MKRILLALGILGFIASGFSTEAEAACAATSAVMKDNASTTFNMGLAADPNANCSSYFTPIQGAALLSATNGWYTNLLQGNTVIAAGNPLFAQLTTGSAIAGKFGIDQTTPGTTNAVSLAQVNAATTLAGNGVTGTGSQRVTIASDNTAFSVNATLQAAASTAIGKVDPNTIGNWGLQASTQNSAAPTNGQLVLCQFTTSPTTITTTNVSPVQCDNSNNMLVKVSNTNANGQATAANSSPVVAPVLTVAGAAVVKGGVPVVNGGSGYQAVAASQTATTLQSSTGATGDYLSHCVIYPTSTSPGAVTVFDSTNTAANSAILFAGGASSTSNLTPISVPVGANSINGAWKVTTGSAVSVVCYGKFS